MDLGNKKILKSALFWGVLCSFVYLGLIVWVLRWERVFLFFTLGDLNNIGDFLAGVLGPLSIGWVVLGYWQNQGALREQADELRNAVVTASDHLEIERRKVEPDVELTDLTVITRVAIYPRDGYGEIDSTRPSLPVAEVDFIFDFINKGAKCPTVRVCLCGDSDFPEAQVWDFDYKGPEYAGIESGSPARHEHRSRDLSSDKASFYDRTQLRTFFEEPTEPFFVRLEWHSGSGKSSVTYRSDSLYGGLHIDDKNSVRKMMYERDGFVTDRRRLKIGIEPAKVAR